VSIFFRMAEESWLSDGEEEDHNFEYYFDNDRGIDFKFVAGSRATECEGRRVELVQKGQQRMREEFRYLQPDDLYDSDADEADDKWMATNASGALAVPTGAKGPPRVSDALLSCPCCFATVCVDCVKHDEVANQWRAIDVLNCTADASRLYFYKEPPAPPRPRGRGPPARRLGGRRGLMGAESDDEASDDEEEEARVAARLHPSNPLHPVPAGQESALPPEDLYRTVHCEACSVQVGVVDLNGIYHLFRVLPSNA